ncbi:unnamed protein product [Schistocephalus solidus]|uniref:Uncharacterized protein n=1 Tax=Schistocephalus solidus TaxID=70667 RepID=A0A183SVL5_SCHSO|nr:unnamed protein product [Schistocephalus solidus]
MSERDDNMDVSETVILPVSDFRSEHPFCTPRELISQISSIANNLQTVLASAPSPEDSFTILSSSKPAYKDMSSALSLSCDGTPDTTLSAEELTHPPTSLLSSDIPCCTATADLEPVPAGATPDDLSSLTRLKQFLRTVNSRSLTDLAASFQTFCDHFMVLDTERLLLEEECTSLRAAVNTPHRNDLNQTTVFEMIEKVCLNAEDSMEELRSSLKEARSQAVEFEAKVESLTTELSKQSASSTHLRSKLDETQEQLQARTAALSNLEKKNAALEEQVSTQEKRISSLDAAYEKTLENLRSADARVLETKAKNTTLSEQVCTLQERLSNMGSELKEVREQLSAANANFSKATVLLQKTATSIGLDQKSSVFDLLGDVNSWCERLFQARLELHTYGWLRSWEHPGDIHYKFDPNANPYKLLELQEQKLADSRDFIDDLGVEIADLKKDRARLREQVDRLDSMNKRFEKEAADKNHQLQRYQEFFQNLFEPKRAAEFAEMVARKFKKAGSLHSEGGSRTLSTDSMKKDGCPDVPPARMTPVTSQGERQMSVPTLVHQSTHFSQKNE